MVVSRRRTALTRAVCSAVPRFTCACEQLEQRRLFNANDPVLVLVEPVQDYRIDAVLPYLWHSPTETLFDPHVDGSPAPDGVDRDGNGYADDAYGWNFGTNSPIFAVPNTTEGHGTVVTNSALNSFNAAGTGASRVKIMYVLGALTANSGVNSAALQYILDKKASDANIVAISWTPTRVLQ